MSWDIVRLGDACSEDKTIVGGKSSSIPYLGLEMIESETGRIDWSENTVEGISTCYSFDARHILYGKLRPYLNKVALPEREGRCSTEIIPLLPKGNSCREYIAYLLRRKETIDYVMPENTGSRMPRADMKHLLDMEIPHPPLDEQRRIAAEVERQLAIVEKAKQAAMEQLAAAQALNAAYLREVFEGNEWNEASLNTISENLDSRRIPIAQSNRKKGEYPYYGASGVVDYVDDYIFDEPILLVSEDGANLFARTYPIAFSVEGKCWVNNHVHVLRFDNRFTQKFVEIYLNSADISEYISGSAQPKLNQEKLYEITIPLPSPDEQQRIVEYYEAETEKTEKAITAIQAQLDIINAMPTAVLRQAFSGQM